MKRSGVCSKYVGSLMSYERDFEMLCVAVNSVISDKNKRERWKEYIRATWCQSSAYGRIWNWQEIIFLNIFTHNFKL